MAPRSVAQLFEQPFLLGLAKGLRRCAAQGEAVVIRAGDRAEESDARLRT